MVSRQALYLIIPTGFLFLAAPVVYPTPTNNPQSATPTIEAKPSPSPIDRPKRLVIPGINVDSFIERVGVTSNGAMDVPSNTSNAGWYKIGPKPGEPGSAVIAGHLDDSTGNPGVFNKIDTLRPGDKIYVTDEQGATSTFVVRSSKTYNSNDDASVIFNATDGKAHLNLITCQGVWNEAKSSYSHRLVVFADKET